MRGYQGVGERLAHVRHGSRPLASPAGSIDLVSMDADSFDYRRLSIAERLQVVEDIWDSIAADADSASLPVTEAEQALLDQRLAEREAQPNAGAPWADVRARITDRRR